MFLNGFMEQTGHMLCKVQVSGQIWHHYTDQLLEWFNLNAEMKDDIHTPAVKMAQTLSSFVVSESSSPNQE